jgi:hypothetical protein
MVDYLQVTLSCFNQSFYPSRVVLTIPFGVYSVTFAYLFVTNLFLGESSYLWITNNVGLWL